MRTIKFRGFSSNMNKWVYGGIKFIDSDAFIIHPQGIQLDFANSVINNSVGQFTGLTDKNGVEIYEGDIINYGRKDNNTKVTFENGCFSVFGEPLGWDFDSEEKPIVLLQCYNYGVVVGNVYENPELLK